MSLVDKICTQELLAMITQYYSHITMHLYILSLAMRSGWENTSIKDVFLFWSLLTRSAVGLLDA